MNKKILGIGNAIVDVLAKVDDEFLIKRNFIKGSMKLINKSEFEDLKKNIKIEKIVAGGSVANTMSGIAYLKGDSSFIGKINSDNFGELYKKTLEREQQIKDMRFNLVVMWENDWKKFIRSIRTLQKIWKKYSK